MNNNPDRDQEADRLAAWEAGQDAFYAGKHCTPPNDETYPDAWCDGWNDALDERRADDSSAEWAQQFREKSW